MKLNVFQKIITSFSLLTFIVLLTGCPFSSSVPIDEGTVKVSDQLAGKWISTEDAESENPTYFEISKDDKFHATARKMEFSSADSSYSATVYKLTFSDVNGETFMNAIEEGGSTYNLYKFSFDEKSGEINTSEVSDYIKETFNTSKELKDFIAKNKGNSYFFTNTNEIYVRK
jgi:peptide methionine sulfoxide reductase MsrA